MRQPLSHTLEVLIHTGVTQEQSHITAIPLKNLKIIAYNARYVRNMVRYVNYSELTPSNDNSWNVANGHQAPIDIYCCHNRYIRA